MQKAAFDKGSLRQAPKFSAGVRAFCLCRLKTAREAICIGGFVCETSVRAKVMGMKIIRNAPIATKLMIMYLKFSVELRL